MVACPPRMGGVLVTERVIEETWTAVGIGYAVANSTPEANGTAPIVGAFILMLVDPGCTRKITIPISEEMRQSLLRDLAGGVIIARPGELGGAI